MPLWFQSQMLWGFLFLMQVSFAWGILGEVLFLSPPRTHSMPPASRQSCISSLPTLSSCGLFSTVSCGDSTLPVFGHFLAYLQWCGCYLVVSVGWDEVRVLLLGHLPRKFWYLYNIKWTDPQHRIYSIYSYNYLHTLVEFNIFEIWVLCIPHKDNSQVP